MLIRTATPGDLEWITDTLRQRWGDTSIASRGMLHDASALPAAIAEDDRRLCGLVTYRIDEAECEIVTLDALAPRHGVGTALVEFIAGVARRHGCERLLVITTNDNLDALRFYQRRGFALHAVYAGAVEAARRLKPQIPVIGPHGIAVRDEIELRRGLTP